MRARASAVSPLSFAFCLFTFALLLALRPFEVVGDVEADLAVFDLGATVARLRVELPAGGLYGHVELELLAAQEHERVDTLVDRALHEGRDQPAQKRRHPFDVHARHVQLTAERLLVRREAEVEAGL